MEEEKEQEKAPPEGKISALRVTSLLLVSTLGGALLARWALAYHPNNEQLWMVPVGLVLCGTPVMVWFADFAATV